MVAITMWMASVVAHPSICSSFLFIPISGHSAKHWIMRARIRKHHITTVTSCRKPPASKIVYAGEGLNLELVLGTCLFIYQIWLGQFMYYSALGVHGTGHVFNRGRWVGVPMGEGRKNGVQKKLKASDSTHSCGRTFFPVENSLKSLKECCIIFKGCWMMCVIIISLDTQE